MQIHVKFAADSIHTFPKAYQNFKRKRYFKNLYANPGQNCRQIPSIPFLTPNNIVKEKKVLQKPVCKSWSKLQTDSIHTFPNA